MNIYWLGWVQEDAYSLSAVVIAETERGALEELALNLSYNGDVRVKLIGVCTDGTTKTETVCRESL